MLMTDWLSGYQKNWLRPDILAGLPTAVVVIPKAILADLGVAQGHRTIPWFRNFYKVMPQANVDFRWTAIGVVDADITSARSVLEWEEELLDPVDYVIVHNHYQEGVASAGDNPNLEFDVRAFREMFSQFEIRDARRPRPDLQSMMRTMNVTLADVG